MNRETVERNHSPESPISAPEALPSLPPSPLAPRPPSPLPLHLNILQARRSPRAEMTDWSHT